MKRILKQMLTYKLIFIGMILMLTACGAEQEQMLTPIIAPTETPMPTPTPDLNDPVQRGEILFNRQIQAVGFACSTCHYAQSDSRFLGPGLAGLSERIEFYGLGVEPAEYIETSIVDPQAFIVPDRSPYPPNLMPRNYAEVLTQEEIDDLVAFILSL